MTDKSCPKPDSSVNGLKRRSYAGLIAAAILGGLASRSSLSASLPVFVTNYAGDTLWAFMVYMLIAFARPTILPGRIAGLALLFATLIEVSQLFKPAWLEFLRELPGMRLVLGYGFLWSDFLCYFIGVGVGCLLDSQLRTAMWRRHDCCS